MSTKKLFINCTSALASKFVGAAIQIIGVPVAIAVFGKDRYGLIVIAMSLNAFVALLQFGIPTAMPKFVAEWLTRGDRRQLNVVLRPLATIYAVAGAIACIVLLALALFCASMFRVSPDQVDTLRSLLIVTAIVSLISIPANNLDQMLVGAQELGFVSGMEVIKNLLFALLLLVVYINPDCLSLVQFYVLQCATMFIMLSAKLRRWSKYASLRSLIPGRSITATAPLLRYSAALMLYSTCVTVADRVRPVLLGARLTSHVSESLADYGIVNNIRVFLMMLTSSFVAALVPYIASESVSGNAAIARNAIEKGTKYIWMFGALVGFGVMMLSKEVLRLYVGRENVYLHTGLVVFVGSSLYSLYMPAIISVVLSSGRLSMLIVTTAVSGVVSTVACWLLAPTYGLYAVAISMGVYSLTHFLLVHTWLLPRQYAVPFRHHVLNIVCPPLIAGAVMLFAGRWVIERIGSSSSLLNIWIGATCGTAIYLGVISLIYIKPRDLYRIARMTAGYA